MPGQKIYIVLWKEEVLAVNDSIILKGLEELWKF
jgi:hypothetical protein